MYSPMASGLLTGAMTRERAAKLPDDDWRKHSPEFREPNLSKNLKLVERLKKVAARYGRTPGEVASVSRTIFGKPAERHLRVGRRRNHHPLELLNVVPKIERIAEVIARCTSRTVNP